VIRLPGQDRRLQRRRRAHLRGEPRSIIGSSLEPLSCPDVRRAITLHPGLPAGQGPRGDGSIIQTEGWHRLGPPGARSRSASPRQSFGEQAHLPRLPSATSPAAPRTASASARSTSWVMRAQRIESAWPRSRPGMAHDFAKHARRDHGLRLGAARGAAAPRAPYSDAAADRLALAHRARRLTESLLHFSGPGERSLEPVALGRVVRNVTGMLRRSIPRGVDVKAPVSPAGTLVDGDAAQLEAVPDEPLPQNARDAMPDGGELRICTRRLELEASQAAAEKLPPGRYWCWPCANNGLGMDQETLDRWGQPFFSTQAARRGPRAGLNVVRTIVAAHRRRCASRARRARVPRCAAVPGRASSSSRSERAAPGRRRRRSRSPGRDHPHRRRRPQPSGRWRNGCWARSATR